MIPKQYNREAENHRPAHVDDERTPRELHVGELLELPRGHEPAKPVAGIRAHAAAEHQQHDRV